MNEMDYIYLGDKMTRPELRRMPCRAVRRFDGKCIRGKNGICWSNFRELGKLLYWANYYVKSKNKKKNLWRLKKYTYICSVESSTNRPGGFPDKI
jgi:hypothetical protein|nr:MAG TPA: hypothetical protein [Caudoviricetes sp.]